MNPCCDSRETVQAKNLSESSMTSTKTNGLSHSQSQSSLLSNQNIKIETIDAGVPRLLVEAGFALFLMAFLVERHYWLWLTISFIVFRFFYSNLGRRCLKTLPRDLKGLYTLFRVKFIIKMAMKRNLPLHHYFLEHMKSNPNAECVVDIETGRTFTFAEFNKLANKYANFYRDRGYKKDDVVALFVENSPEFFAIWLGLSKLGVITAWINTNLKMEPLGYSIKVSKAKSVITCSRLLSHLRTAIDEGHLEDSLKIYLIDGNDNGHDNLAELIKDSSEPPLTPGLHFQSILCYIYTSGTTGNPKPAIIKHFRYYWICVGCSRSFGLSPKDRVYLTMPMYHSAAGILGVGQVIASGATIVIRKKFSASNFWKDCVKYRCTASQYIGEIARYLLAQKPCPEERLHNVWIMFGNGFRGEIWSEFVQRFGIKVIGEFYGSTEGNSNIVNLDSHVGACGFFPIYPFLTVFYPVRLLKVDPETGVIVRDENGLCISCRPGDMGEMVGVIRENDPLLRFEGYVEKGDTQNKIIRDVCKKGDAVFSSGDVLYWDELGYLYFKDRRGDTYRWKGENVSTMEVEGILQPIMEIEDATVYGVEIRGREGRAGMIGVSLRNDANVEHFLNETARKLSENLASYAIPIFLRICKEVDKTGTFKLKKIVLQKDGFDLERCHGDPIYYWDGSEMKYKLMDQEMQNKIETGEYSKI